MYVKKSVPRAAGSPGIGIQTRDHVSLIDVDDILFMPEPDSAGVVIVDDIILKPNAYAIDLYLTPGTHEVTSGADGDTDKVGFTPSFKGEHPGNEQEVREFKANCINKKFIVVIRYCSGKPADLIGTLCNPCKFMPSYTGYGESNTNEMTFTQISKGPDIFIYKGTLPMEEPLGALEETGKLQFVGDGQYQLINSQLTSIIGGAHGSVITLLGPTEGECPIADDEHVKFIAGNKFTLKPGAQITLRAFNAGTEGGGLLWLEQSRYVG